MLCFYKRTIFNNSKNGYTIAEYETDDESVPKPAIKIINGKSKVFIAKGYYIPENPDMEIELEGDWVGSEYGVQLDVKNFMENLPSSKEGIIGYLSSGCIRGIGSALANAVYERFGDKTFEVFDKEPDKLLEIKGITELSLEKIKSSYQDNRSLKDIITLLSPFGISAAKATRIKKHFGSSAAQILKENPFKMCEISGFGFATVDKISRKLKCGLTEPLRIQSCIEYIIEQAASGSGHLFVPRDWLFEQAYDMLNKDFPAEIVKKELIQLEINNLVKLQKIVYEEQYKIIYLRKYFFQEYNTAKAVAGYLSQPKYNININEYLEQAQKELNIILSPEQSEAVEMCINHGISIITGGPGTGKTTVLKVIIYIYSKLFPKNTISLAAPTGKASRRMEESTGLSAQTMHALLGLLVDDDSYGLNDDSDLDCDLLILDEQSMVDMRLAHELFLRLDSAKTKILLVGDADQLPSVGPGNVFRELLKSKFIPKVSFKSIYRQSEGSLISLNAHRINKGEFHLEYGDSFKFIECNTDNEANDIIVRTYIEALKNLDVQDIQVLTPRKDKVECSSKKLNELLREVVNPSAPAKEEANIGSRLFRVHDRVMQTRNVPPVFNGDTGIITGFKKDKENKNKVEIDFNGKVVSYYYDEMNIIELSYAMTIHKSQGSEYHTVIIPLLNTSYTMLMRNLVYTAITRAKTNVIIVGRKTCLYTAIRNLVIDQRNTILNMKIKKLFKEPKNKNQLHSA